LRFRERRLEVQVLFLILFNLILLSVQGQADFWVRGVAAVCSPPVRLLHGVLDGVAGYFSRLEAMKKAEAENRDLKNQLLWTRLANDRLRLENLYLGQFYKMEEQPLFETGPQIRASIIRRKLSSYFSEVLIDAGYLKGVKVRQVAITPDGLVGIVEEVASTTSVVKPIIHPDAVVSVVDLRSGCHAVAKGDGTGFLELKYLPPYSDVVVGDAFYTDCWDFLYAPGLQVGTVLEAVPEESQLKVRLKPTVDLSAQKWLVLIKEAS
jgi:rod shape-determining protein MreC